MFSLFVKYQAINNFSNDFSLTSSESKGARSTFALSQFFKPGIAIDVASQHELVQALAWNPVCFSG